jgi:hypothetical protein
VEERAIVTYLLLAVVVGLCVLLQGVDRREEQVVTLNAGETFLGVLDRRKGNYVFVGTNPQRAYADITPEEVTLLK